MSLNFSSASGEGFLSGWYYTQTHATPDIEGPSASARRRGETRTGTDLDRLLAVRLLEVGVVHVGRDAELHARAIVRVGRHRRGWGGRTRS